MESWSVAYIIISSYALTIGLYFLRRWFKGGVCVSKARLDGKTVIITGANAGIGKETAIDLARRGAIVVMACRDRERGLRALQEVQEKSGSSKVFLEILDLASLASVHEFADTFLSEYPNLHILINNAGIGSFSSNGRTKDGFAGKLGVNHLGHFALTNLLLERLVKCAPSRIVNVSSKMHEFVKLDFDDLGCEKPSNFRHAYGVSKLANVIFAKELHRRLKGTGVSTFSLHPGLVETEIWRNMNYWARQLLKYVISYVGKTAEEGAQTTIYCAVEEGIETHSGLYFSDCAVKKSNKQSYDEGVAKKLWQKSEKMTNVKFPL